MVPPWVPDQPVESDTSPSKPDAPDRGDVQSSNLVAPSNRFRGTRLALGNFAHTGDADYLRRGLGRYVRNGYGGARTAARRMDGTASTAGALYGVLSDISTSKSRTQGGSLEPALLTGKSAREVTDAIVGAVRPIDGTQDTEAARVSIRNALSDLLYRFPEADL